MPKPLSNSNNAVDFNWYTYSICTQNLFYSNQRQVIKVQIYLLRIAI